MHAHTQTRTYIERNASYLSNTRDSYTTTLEWFNELVNNFLIKCRQF